MAKQLLEVVDLRVRSRASVVPPALKSRFQMSAGMPAVLSAARQTRPNRCLVYGRPVFGSTTSGPVRRRLFLAIRGLFRKVKGGPQDRGPASFADLVDLFEVVALNRVDEDHG